MTEVIKKYKITDDEGDVFDLEITNRFCGCQSPGCVDDELAIDVDQDGGRFRIQIPRDMTCFIEGLIDGTYSIKKAD